MSTNLEEDFYHCLAAVHDWRHRAASAPIIAAGITCPTCNSICAPAFGLRSHIWTHHWMHNEVSSMTITHWEPYPEHLLGMKRRRPYLLHYLWSQGSYDALHPVTEWNLPHPSFCCLLYAFGNPSLMEISSIQQQAISRFAPLLLLGPLADCKMQDSMSKSLNLEHFCTKH